MTLLFRLHQTIQDGGVPIDGVGPANAGQPVGPGNVAVSPLSMQLAAQPIIDTFDWSDAAQAAWENLQARTAAKATVGTGSDYEAKVLRAIAAVLLDEVNTLRQWLTSFKSEMALATNLADLKTRVATLPATPDRTLAQAKTAIRNKLDGGTVD